MLKMRTQLLFVLLAMSVVGTLSATETGLGVYSFGSRLLLDKHPRGPSAPSNPTPPAGSTETCPAEPKGAGQKLCDSAEGQKYLQDFLTQCITYRCAATRSVTELVIKDGGPCVWSNVYIAGDGVCVWLEKSVTTEDHSVSGTFPCTANYRLFVKQGDKHSRLTLPDRAGFSPDSPPSCLRGGANGQLFSGCDWCELKIAGADWNPCAVNKASNTDAACGDGGTTCGPKKYTASCECTERVNEAVGKPCGPAAEACEVAQAVCNGVSSVCPAKEKRPATHVCGPPTLACEKSRATCTGTDPTCPANPRYTVRDDFTCRAAEGDCDEPEKCTGDATCPTDKVYTTTQKCRSAVPGLACDKDDYCDGTNKGCTDTFLPRGTTCGPKQKDCEKAVATCPGTSGVCPENDMYTAEDNHVCRPATTVCDEPEICDGVDRDCPTNAFASRTKQCGTTPKKACEKSVATCTGTSDVCPANPVYIRDDNEICRKSQGDCDIVEYCEGGVDCPADAVHDSDKVCQEAQGPCDAPEYCPGGPEGYDCPTKEYTCDLGKRSASTPDKWKENTCKLNNPNPLVTRRRRRVA